ncbi:MAG TPA: hypothetical protein VF062_13360 [Candidatus Limnocylindrales bacterium]
MALDEQYETLKELVRIGHEQLVSDLRTSLAEAEAKGNRYVAEHYRGSLAEVEARWEWAQKGPHWR